MADNIAPRKVVKKTTRKTTTRKAPTRVSRSVTKSKENNLPIFIGIGIFILVLGVSAAVGYSDKGSINVSGVISEKKNSGTEEEKAAIKNIPVQQAKSATPDGGLVPTTDVDTSVTKKNEAESASSTEASATSTDQTASSTDDLVTEESDTETEETAEETQ